MAALTSTVVGPTWHFLDCKPRRSRHWQRRLVKPPKAERKRPSFSRRLFVRYSLCLLLHKHLQGLGHPCSSLGLPYPCRLASRPLRWPLLPLVCRLMPGRSKGWRHPPSLATSSDTRCHSQPTRGWWAFKDSLACRCRHKGRKTGTDARRLGKHTCCRSRRWDHHTGAWKWLNTLLGSNKVGLLDHLLSPVP